MKDFIEAVELSAKIRDDFAALVTIGGPVKAFEIMAGHMIADRKPDSAISEEDIVKVVRAAYDDYVQTHPVGP